MSWLGKEPQEAVVRLLYMNGWMSELCCRVTELVMQLLFWDIHNSCDHTHKKWVLRQNFVYQLVTLYTTPTCYLTSAICVVHKSISCFQTAAISITVVTQGVTSERFGYTLASITNVSTRAFVFIITRYTINIWPCAAAVTWITPLEEKERIYQREKRSEKAIAGVSLNHCHLIDFTDAIQHDIFKLPFKSRSFKGPLINSFNMLLRRWNFTSSYWRQLAGRNEKQLDNLQICLHFRCFAFVFNKMQNKRSTSEDKIRETLTLVAFFILLKCTDSVNCTGVGRVSILPIYIGRTSSFFKC